MSEGFYGVHVGGADGGVESEHDADKSGDGEGEYGGPGFDDGGLVGEVGDEGGYADAEEYAESTAGAGEQDGFDEKLEDDVASFCAEGASDTDFAGAFGDAGEHDVHDADAANDE